MKIIGICSLFFYLKNRCPCGKCYRKSVVNNTYINMIQSIGAIPIIIPVINNKLVLEKYIKMIDCLLICGNKLHPKKNIIPNDIDKTKLIQDELHNRDTILLDYCIKYKKKVIGICYGMEFINSYFNGSIYSDIVKQLKSNNHQKTNHNIILNKDSFFYKIINKEIINVNSFHEAGITKELLSDKLISSSMSDDGIVESFETENKLIFGFQFHIELLKDKYIIIKKILNTVY